MLKDVFSSLVVFMMLTFSNICIGQDVTILDYSVNGFDQVQLEIEAQADKYYLLTTLHGPNLDYESITSITMGIDGNMIISEPAGAFPLSNYKVTAYDIADPEDTDGDGIDDITEFNNMPEQSPLNYARSIPRIDGTAAVPTRDVFSELAVVDDDIPWAPFLNNQEFVKFAIVNQGSDEPEIYFINSKTHYIHQDFLATINVNRYSDDVTAGEIVYNPNTILSNGAIGSYSFNYSFGAANNFEITRKTFELLVKNMPFLNNNLQHFIGNGGENTYNTQFKNDFEGSRINVVLESELFADIDFLPFNQAEGYGFFKSMGLNDNPGSRDIVLYDALPNSLPRVGGIITSVIQTPLSHVNLRAIQDNVPNAYIKNPLGIDSINNLLGKYIYYKVTQDSYEIREATLEEVNDWYEELRPTEAQIPNRDLSYTTIMPLDEIEFEMSTAFGAKCSNVATMRRFGFPEGTIPNGFGVPFYFYDEFMKFNGFYPKVEAMITDPAFLSDLETRIDMLKDFRKEIKDADMPQWMLDELEAMHDTWPEGTSIRCRSSTNNEDLPGFSGAGLYTSKTQHPDEGHISKSIKQVYASMWNFRAYDERDFYRVDHYIAAMGVLCHPNFEDEKSNGVGVSLDPIYQTDNTFYLNTQVGEFLITNPDANSIPEEILLSEDPNGGYFTLRSSNLVPDGVLVMSEEYLNQLRDYLTVIHDEFEILYDVVGAEGFGMDIEYKVTKDDQLIIKQARPWVSFWADIKANSDLASVEIIEPVNSASLGDAELVTARIDNRGLKSMQDFDISLLVDNILVETLTIDSELRAQTSGEYQFTIPQDFSEVGDYNLSTIVSHVDDGYDKNDTLSTVLTKLHLIEGQITVSNVTSNCGEDVDVTAKVKNLGESTFNILEIEAVVNGMVVDVAEYALTIPYLSEATININITENLMAENNVIELNLLNINGGEDAVMDNNSSTIMADLASESDFVSLIINADEYSEETSWAITNEVSNQIIASGRLVQGLEVYTEEICLNYNSCYTLTVFDSAGDGLCCGWGEGNFLMVNSAGDTLLTNSGEFTFQVEEDFCVNSIVCSLSADIITTDASSESAADGIISITTSNGVAPYQYSVDGGSTYVDENVITDLPAGSYMVVVKDATENCIYEETIELSYSIMSTVEDITSASINVYPNPTAGNITIELIEEAIAGNGSINVEIYNGLGLLLQSTVISSAEGEAIISLDNYQAGSYIARCYNQDSDIYFKILKM